MRDEMFKSDGEALMSLEEWLSGDSLIVLILQHIESFYKTNGRLAYRFSFTSQIGQSANPSRPAKVFVTTYEDCLGDVFPFDYWTGNEYVVDHPALKYTEDGKGIIPDNKYTGEWYFKGDMVFIDVKEAERRMAENL